MLNFCLYPYPNSYCPDLTLKKLYIEVICAFNSIRLRFFFNVNEKLVLRKFIDVRKTGLSDGILSREISITRRGYVIHSHFTQRLELRPI